jgi:hypothetical protein
MGIDGVADDEDPQRSMEWKNGRRRGKCDQTCENESGPPQSAANFPIKSTTRHE